MLNNREYAITAHNPDPNEPFLSQLSPYDVKFLVLSLIFNKQNTINDNAVPPTNPTEKFF